MGWSSSLAWLATLAARREAHFAETDCADMGTAFGLDASVGGAADPWRDAASAPQNHATESWERRVVRRSSL